jgi:DNA-binding HxlR family transcriptional regulator
METKRKNRNYNPGNCGVTHFLNRIGGKWKVLIIYAISKRQNRLSLIQRLIPSLNKQTLVNQLRELVEDGILERTIYAEVPPRVEYTITKYGQSLMPVIRVIQDWGCKDLEDQSK